jgi:WD40 repeat protein
VERWLTRESDVLGDRKWWPKTIPGLFGQQLYNRSLEDGQPQVVKHIPRPWLRQMNRIGAESRFLLRIFYGSSDPVWSASFSPDGTMILTSSGDSKVRLWETNGILLMTWQNDYFVGAGHPCFSPDGSRILINLSKGAGLVDTKSGNLLATLKDPYWDGVGMTVATFSPSGDQVLTGSGIDNTANLWETQSGNLLTKLVGHTNIVTRVAFSQNGELVITGSENGSAYLWNAANGQLLMVLRGHQEQVNCVAVAPNEAIILTCSADATYLWGIVDERKLGILHAFGGSSAEEGCLFSPDGTMLLTGSHNSEAELWDVVSGQRLRTFQGHYGAISHIAFSPDGRKVALVSSQRMVHIWETQTGDLLAQLDGHTDTVTRVAFSPNGEQVITSSMDGTTRLWEIGRIQNASDLQGHFATITSVAFSPDGRLAITGSNDCTARLWEVASGQSVRMFGNWLDQTGEGHTDSVSSVAFSPDGNFVLTGSWDGMARLWDTESGKPLRPFRGRFGAVRGVAFSPDGFLVAISSDDGIVRICWTRDNVWWPIALEGHTGWVECIAFSPDASRVLTGSLDKTARLWTVHSGQKLGTPSEKVSLLA